MLAQFGPHRHMRRGNGVGGVGSYLVSYRGPDGLGEELDADDGQQADAHRQDDGQPQVGLPQGVGGRACTHVRDRFNMLGTDSSR